MKYIKLKTYFRNFLFAVSILACLSLCACQKEEAPPPINIPSQSPEEEKEESEVRPPDIEIDSEILGFVVETPAPPSPTPEIFSPDLVAKEAKPVEFFENSAFMGNSIMDGFRMFSGLTTCDYYVATSMTVQNAINKQTITLDNGMRGSLVDGLCQKPYDHIYILLGINEIHLGVDVFIAQYEEMIDKIQEAQEDCDIYIMSLTPVSKTKSDSDKNFNMPNITVYNEALYNLAIEQECYYMDLVAALGDSEGYLEAKETSDGVHFAIDTYHTWYDYVITHYA